MATTFICPYCHSPVDPRALELARCGQAELRVCPACDGPLPFATRVPAGSSPQDARDEDQRPAKDLAAAGRI